MFLTTEFVNNSSMKQPSFARNYTSYNKKPLQVETFITFTCV